MSKPKEPSSETASDTDDKDSESKPAPKQQGKTFAQRGVEVQK